MKTEKISYQLKELIAKSVNAVFEGQNMTVEHVFLEHPSAEEHGDYSTNVAMVLAKQGKGESVKGEELDENPRVIADRIITELHKSVSSEGQGARVKGEEIIEKMEVAGPGFINITLSTNWLIQQVRQVLADHESYGSSNEADAIGKWKTVIVEYSSPNIAKPFGIGHLRSTIIGDAMQRLLKSQGYNVVTDNHLGDWGTQFGKMCYAIKHWGNEEEIFTSSEPIKSLVRLYVKFHTEAKNEEETTGKTTILDGGREWFAKLEKGDSEAKRLWKLCVDASMKEFMEIYELLGISFDYFNGEAFFEDKLTEIVELARKSKYVRENDGALLVFFPDENKAPLMLLKSDGSTLYATRDLATDKYRIDTFGKETFIINETGLEQGFYWQQVYEAEELLGICSMAQRKALLHGLMLSVDGKKFSTRKGDELWLKDVLEEAVAKARKIMEERKIGEELPEEEKAKIAKAVGIGGMKYNDLKQGHQKDIVFDWEKVINMEGDSGPYIQYTYARAKSVLRKVDNHSDKPRDPSTTLGITKEEMAILRWLYRFPEVVEQAARTYSPNIVCSYLFELAKRYNNLYNNVQILKSERVDFLLGLTDATSIVLKNGLNLLGIEALERM